VLSLGIQDQVEVVCGDVEVLRHQERFTHSFDAACSRGFGPPLHTLRWAVSLVRLGGYVVVSEPPPGSPDRWVDVDLGSLGVSDPTRLGPVALFHVEHF